MTVNPAPTLTLTNGVRCPTSASAPGRWTTPRPPSPSQAHCASATASSTPQRTMKTSAGSVRASAIPALTAPRCSSPPSSTASGTVSRVPARPARPAWPASGWTISICCWCTGPTPTRIAMSRLSRAWSLCSMLGLVRAIGTSNFKPAHLQRLFDQGMTPHVNQIQLDPYHLRSDLVAIHRARGIVTGTWSPLGRGNQMLEDSAITAIAETPWPHCGAGGAALAHPAGFRANPEVGRSGASEGEPGHLRFHTVRRGNGCARFTGPARSGDARCGQLRALSHRGNGSTSDGRAALRLIATSFSRRPPRRRRPRRFRDPLRHCRRTPRPHQPPSRPR